jgi:hypothetical protein
MRIKKHLLESAHKLGQGKTAVKYYDKLFKLSSSTEIEIENKISNYTLNDKKGDILIPLVRGDWGIVSYRACILAHAFKTRGYQPVIPLCDSSIPICNRKKPGNESDSVCDICNYTGQKLMEKFGIEPIPLPELDLNEYQYEAKDTKETIEYKQIPISRYAKATTRKYLRKYNINSGDKYEIDVYNRCLASAAYHVDITKKILDKYDVKAAVGPDPVYNESGVYLKTAAEHDLPAYSDASGYRNGYLIFGKLDDQPPLPQFTDKQVVKNYLDSDLDKKELDEISQIMESRRSGGAVRVPYSKKGKSLNQNPENVMVGMFTNLIWDASLEVESAPFTDVFDWIYTTIDEFIDTDYNLVIRTHPVEAMRETNESVAESIRERYNDLPDNITLIYPDEDVNTYQLMEQIDAGLVYNSTVGMEMAYNNIPVVIGGDTHYRGLGFTYDPETPREYIEIIKDISDIETKKGTSELAQKYAHFLFVQKHIEFPFFDLNSSVSGDLIPINHADIKPGNKNFDIIVNSIISGEPVIK